MAFSTRILAFSILACASAAGYQDSYKTFNILDLKESEQRQFIAEYLDEGVPLGFRVREGFKSVPSTDMTTLAEFKPWVIPILEERTRQWMKEPITNKERIEVMAFTLADTGRPQALDSLLRLFGGQEVASKYIRILLATKLDSPWFNHFTLLYRAIDSTDATVQTLAQEVIPKLLQFPSDHRLSNWADAMVERYNHVPTTRDIIVDPLVELVRIHDLIRAEEVRQRLAKHTLESYQKRQLLEKSKRK